MLKCPCGGKLMLYRFLNGMMFCKCLRCDGMVIQSMGGYGKSRVTKMTVDIDKSSKFWIFESKESQF